jgi:hypothetical protein
MENTNDYLKEFETTKTKSNRIDILIERLDFVFIIYIIILLIFKHLVFKESFKTNMVYPLLFVIVLPILFWVLYIKSYKTGWFLRVLYYSILVIILGVNLISKKMHLWVQVHFIIVIMLSLVIVATSFIRKTLKKLKIGSILRTTYIFVVTLLLVSFVYAVLIKK